MEQVADGDLSSVEEFNLCGEQATANVSFAFPAIVIKKMEENGKGYHL